MPGRSRRRIAVALAAALASCESVPPNAVTSCQQTSVAPSKADILFVIDDSGSMSEEQQNLSQNLDAFIRGLAEAPVRPDYQIGVTTTSVVGFDGATAYTAVPNAGVPYPAGALIALDPVTHAIKYDAASRTFTGNRILRAGASSLVEDFKANVLVGTNGSSKEMALDVARRALSASAPGGVNAGFLRPGARLGIVILSDEDDCTEPAGQDRATSDDACHDPSVKQSALEPVSDFVDFLRGPIAGEVRRVTVAAVIGVDGQTRARGSRCSSAFDTPVRYWDFAHAFGEQGLVDSICDASFADTLTAIASLLSQQVDLAQPPSDVRLLQVGIRHADGSSTACKVVAQGADASGADAIFAPPASGNPATLTFQKGCLLRQGDRIELNLLCAG